MLLVLAGCATMPEKSIKIDGLYLYNKTSAPMHDVEISIQGTSKKIFCSYLAPNKEFSTNYPARKFKGRDISVNWQHRGQNWSSGIFRVGVPKAMSVDAVARPIVFLGEQGSASVRFKQQ